VYGKGSLFRIIQKPLRGIDDTYYWKREIPLIGWVNQELKTGKRTVLPVPYSQKWVEKKVKGYDYTHSITPNTIKPSTQTKNE